MFGSHTTPEFSSVTYTTRQDHGEYLAGACPAAGVGRSSTLLNLNYVRLRIRISGEPRVKPTRCHIVDVPSMVIFGDRRHILICFQKSNFDSQMKFCFWVILICSAQTNVRFIIIIFKYMYCFSLKKCIMFI